MAYRVWLGHHTAPRMCSGDRDNPRGLRVGFEKNLVSAMYLATNTKNKNKTNGVNGSARVLCAYSGIRSEICGTDH